MKNVCTCHGVFTKDFQISIPDEIFIRPETAPEERSVMLLYDSADASPLT